MWRWFPNKINSGATRIQNLPGTKFWCPLSSGGILYLKKKKLTAITGLLWNLLCHLIGKGGLFKNIQCSFKLKEPWSQWFSRMCLLSWDDYLSIGQRKVKLSSTRHSCPDRVRKGRKQKLRLAFKLVWRQCCGREAVSLLFSFFSKKKLIISLCAFCFTTTKFASLCG